MRRILIGLGLVAACVAERGDLGSTNQPGHTATLAAPRVDRLGDGSVVVSQVAGGELAGLVTLTLHPTGSGAYAGEWALMVAHTDNTDPATGLEPPHQHHHKDFVRFVHRGALSGIVSGASLVFDDKGGLAELAAKLAVDQGTQQFAGVTGSGRIDLTNLTLNF